MTKLTRSTQIADSAPYDNSSKAASEIRSAGQLIRVQLTNAKEYPCHGSDSPNKNVSSYQRWRGKFIWVGAPTTPHSFECGTDIIWPVCDRVLLEDLGIPEFYGRIFVCRHQIEAGD